MYHFPHCEDIGDILLIVVLLTWSITLHAHCTYSQGQELVSAMLELHDGIQVRTGQPQRSSD